MMPKRLSPKSTLDTLKTEAKRRLKAMRATDPAAPLRAAQHAVARDYGFDGWTALRSALEDIALGRLSPAGRAEVFLRHCSWDGDVAAARRVLARHPEVARHDLLTAVVCGDIAEVERRLRADPEAARRKAGPLDREPLLYLAYGRFDGENAVAIAGRLLDAGADADAEFNDGWDNPFTVLCGVIGLGEGTRPPHPQAQALADLLLARGARAFNTQALYNTSIAGDDPHWMAFLYEQSAARGQLGEWTASPGRIGGRFKMSTLDYLLGNAVAHGHHRRVEWLVAHGADPNGRHAYSGLSQHTHARVAGDEATADVLARLGARPEELTGALAFQAAALRPDAEAVRAIAAREPAVLSAPGPLITAAGHGRADVVALLLAAGVPADVTMPDGQRPLLAACHSGSVETVRRLVEAGADLEARGTQYDASPLSSAHFFGHAALLDYLVPLTRDVFTLAAANRLDRLGVLLAEDPGLIHSRRKDGRAMLHHLPDDEDEAVEVTRFLLAHGADPTLADDKGVTAIAAARARGLDEAADLMGEGGAA